MRLSFVLFGLSVAVERQPVPETDGFGLHCNGMLLVGDKTSFELVL